MTAMTEPSTTRSAGSSPERDDLVLDVRDLAVRVGDRTLVEDVSFELREKAVAGVRKACKGRPVSEDDLARLGQTVEDTLRAEGWAEVPAHEIGVAILGPLRELDEVAWLRFASVYRAFESADDFEAAITELRAERELQAEPQPKTG